MKIKKLFILPLLACTLFGCKKDEKPKDPDPIIEVIEPTLELPYSELVVMMDKEPIQIQYTLLKKGFISFTSSDTNVARVDRNGIVTAVSEGITIISLKRGEYVATIKVIVVPYAPDSFLKIELANPNLKLLVNDTYTPNYIVKYGSASVDSSEISFTYLYYNNEIISVENNIIKGLAPGNSDVLVSASYNSTISYYTFSVTIL